MAKSKLIRMDNVGIVVQDLKRAIAFFAELGLELEAEMTVEGQWVDRIVGLNGVRNEIAMMKTPDGHNKLELMKFLNPAASGEVNAPVNAPGLRRMMFLVSDIDDTTVRLQKHGAQLIGDMVDFEDMNRSGYRLCYLRGPEGLIVALSEQIGAKSETYTAKSKKSALLRMDNLLIVVDDLKVTSAFFIALGFEFEGEMLVEGPSVDRLIGLKDVRATLAFMRTPDNLGRIELDKFHSPTANGFGAVNTPVNTPGIRRIMLAVEDINDMIANLRAFGAELIGEVVQYKDMYRLCYIRGPEGIIVALAEQIRNKSVKDAWKTLIK